MTSAKGVGLPIKLLHESEGHIVTVRVPVASSGHRCIRSVDWLCLWLVIRRRWHATPGARTVASFVCRVSSASHDWMLPLRRDETQFGTV